MKRSKPPLLLSVIPSASKRGSRTTSSSASGLEGLCARTAYSMAYLGRPNSSSIAIDVLRGKREAAGIGEERLREALVLSLEILQSHIRAVLEFMQDNHVASREDLTREQRASGARAIAAALAREYPENLATVDYYTTAYWNMTPRAARNCRLTTPPSKGMV